MASMATNCPTAISATIPGNANRLVTAVLLPISGPQSDLSNRVLGYSWKEEQLPTTRPPRTVPGSVQTH